MAAINRSEKSTHIDRRLIAGAETELVSGQELQPDPESVTLAPKSVSLFGS